MRKFKQILALFLAVTMGFGMISYEVVQAEPVRQQNDTENTVVNQPDEVNQPEISGDTSVANLLADAVGEQQSEQKQTEYGVMDIQMRDHTATVQISAIDECKLVVALYDNDGKQMSAVGETNVEAGADTCDVTIDIEDMPEYFQVKAFLLDENTSEPLCESFTSKMYTMEFQEYYEKTTADFSEERVLNLDDDETDNFAVYKDSVILIEPQEKTNILEISNSENGIYTFTNADETLQSLEPGNIFAYEYEPGNTLIVKVKTIETDGTTVTITEDKNNMEETFEYVKIEMDQTSGDVEVDNSDMDDCLTYEGTEEKDPQAIDATGTDINIENRFTTKYHIDSNKKPIEKGGGIEGEIKLTFGYSIRLYLYPTYYQLNVKYNPKLEFTGDIYGTFEQSFKMAEVTYMPCPGVNLKFVFYFVFGMGDKGGKLGINASVERSMEILSSTDDIFKINGDSPKVSAQVKMEGNIKIGLKMKGVLELINENIGELTLSAFVGGVAEAKQDTLKVSTTPEDLQHDCTLCIARTIDFELELKAELKLINKFSMEQEATNKFRLGNFYYSVDHNEFRLGTCPYKRYKVEINVLNSGKKPISGVEVECDGKAECFQTDGAGKCYIYLPNGTYNITVSKNGYHKKQKVRIKDISRKIRFTITENGSGTDDSGEYPDDQTETSGTCGENARWELKEDGTLIISGTGEMEDYEYNYDNITNEYTSSTPWKQNEDRVKRVIVEKGITDIGEGAFCCCSNLQEVNIADTVCKIGAWAFLECTNLQSISIPDSVQEIWIGAFNNCKNLKEIELPKGLGVIEPDIFYGCEELQSIHIPDGVEEIRGQAFRNCTNLQNIELPDSITMIGEQAFAEAGLKNIKLPDKLAKIEWRAFYGCSNLESVQIPDGIKRIEECTFSECTNLQEVKLPDSLPEIGTSAFSYCTGLKEIKFPDKLEAIEDFAFSGCEELESIQLPDSLRMIGYEAFASCSKLSTISWSTSPQDMHSDIFRECYELKNLIIPEGLVDAGNFMETSSLEYVVFPKTLKTLNATDDIGKCAVYFTGACVNMDMDLDESENALAGVHTIYYPENDPTWTKENRDYLGGEDTVWIPWNPDTDTPHGSTDNGNTDITEESSNVSEQLQMFATLPEEEGDEISLKTQDYTGLEPDAEYLFVELDQEPEEDTAITADHILYIDQKHPDEAGTLSFQYFPRKTAEDSVTKLFCGRKKDLSMGEITVENLDYTENVQDAKVKVTYQGTELQEYRDYELQGQFQGTDVGTYTVVASGMGDYKGTLSAQYQILANPSGDQPGNNESPDQPATDNGNSGITNNNPGTSGSQNSNAASGKPNGSTSSGNSKNNVTSGNSVRVTPPGKTKLYKPKSTAAGKAKLTWKIRYDASGYQIRYATKSSMRSARTKKISGFYKRSVTLKGLRKGKKYYFQIRAYKKSGGKTSYGKWSSKVSVKIKKK